MYKSVPILVFLFLMGCATGSVRMIGDVATYKSGNCEVKVYQTRSKALESGMEKEICVVEGSSAFSFDHSINGAIKNNIGKICGCGVENAYVESAHTESHMGLKGVSYINLVGFE
ncbi:hypothetical protein GCM10007160_39050 [Litchfieldella qijiaojingensis]|uniref:Lipoprotein n=1 Tax=Litchfieldella qijiaojingensis TaxID=980347 RepID=A0ABQ2ZAM5_9GAMM|nr:hypothetical protein [Halomonas qijiaojingensis]GGY07828.1 hypothetical protein GCM10007160_39050 [Halomonas qijiaojingensis]